MRRNVVARRPQRYVLLPERFVRLGVGLSCCGTYNFVDKTLAQSVGAELSIVGGGHLSCSVQIGGGRRRRAAYQRP